MANTKRIVTVAPDHLFENDSGSFVTLRHPRHGDAALFYMRNDNSLWEVQRYKEKFRSWFIGNSVKSDGSLYFITQFDPLFVAIHYLKQKNRFSTLDTVLEDSEFPEVKQLVDSDLLSKRLDVIADVKSSSGFKAYRYSESKTLQWLERRLRRVEDALRDNDITCCPDGISQASCWKSADASSPQAIRQYALGIVAENLSEELESKLTQLLGVEAAAPVLAAGEELNGNCESENGPPSPKRLKAAAMENDYQEKLQQLVDGTKERGLKPKLKKQPGMQSITNFFKKS